jgi:hypothetical protein
MRNYLLVLKLLVSPTLTFWHRKAGGGWIVKYFPKLQNILKLIPGPHAYLLITNSLKLFWNSMSICLICNLSGSYFFLCLLKQKRYRIQYEKLSINKTSYSKEGPRKEAKMEDKLREA